MTEEYKKRLIQLAKEVQIKIDSPRQYVFPKEHYSIVMEKVNHLIGYILALENL